MCYNTKQTSRIPEIEAKFRIKIPHNEREIRNERIVGFNFPKVPVIRNENKNTLELLNWGLIPHWAKDATIRKNTLNARIETLSEKPAFRDAVFNRCLFVVNGFYEWQWLDSNGKKKKQFLLSFLNEEPFAMAGIYAKWRNPISGSEEQTCSIVTTKACGIMEEIHNSKKRMPIVLNEETQKEWLDGARIEEFHQPGFPLHAISLDAQLNLF